MSGTKTERNVQLMPLLTLRLPVKARWLARVRSEWELLQCARWARQRGLPILLLGGGSNMLLREDFPGLVIQMALRGIERREEEQEEEEDEDGEAEEEREEDDSVLVRVGAGEDWPALVEYTLEKGWFGLEHLADIPGSAGAAPVRNIGAYGRELSDVLEAVEVIDLPAGNARRLSVEECQFSYRRSILYAQDPLRYAVTALHLRLYRQPVTRIKHPRLRAAVEAAGLNPDEIRPRALADIICRLRKQRLPNLLVQPNVGSFFTNPIVDTFTWERLHKKYPQLPGRRFDSGYQLAAGWLIEQAGWKGKRHGPVAVSSQHALVLVNDRDGDGNELMALAERIVADIRDKYGVELTPEPCIY